MSSKDFDPLAFLFTSSPSVNFDPPEDDDLDLGDPVPEGVPPVQRKKLKRPPSRPRISQDAQVALARALAAQALAQEPPKESKKPEAAPATKSKSLTARMGKSAPRGRKKSALEIAQEAAKREAERRAEKDGRAAAAVAKSAPPTASDLSLEGRGDLLKVVHQVISKTFPTLEGFRVINAIDVQKHNVMQVLWKSHRERFISEGLLDRAAAAALVYAALKEPGQRLVAAYVETGASDYLVWVDPKSQSILAAFSDALSYFT
jgi:hypothetical protein